MLTVLFGEFQTGLIITREDRVVEEFFSDDHKSLIAKISCYKDLPVKLLAATTNCRCFHRALPRLGARAAIDIELERLKPYDFSGHFVLDGARNLYLFLAVNLRHYQQDIVRLLHKDAGRLLTIQTECYHLMQEVRKGISTTKGAFEVFIIDTKISGILAFVWKGEILFKCETIEVIDELNCEVLAGFIVQYVTDLVHSGMDNLGGCLIVRDGLVAALLATSLAKRLSHMVLLNPTEASVLTGLEASTIDEHRLGDSALLFPFLSRNRASKFGIRLVAGAKSQLHNFLLSCGSSLMAVWIVYCAFAVYLEYPDYQALTVKHQYLQDKYYKLAGGFALDREDSLLWMQQVFQVIAESPATKIAALHLDSRTIKTLDWQFVYSVDSLITGRELQPEVQLQVDLYEPANIPCATQSNNE